MITVLKVQLPLNTSNPFAIAHNNNGSFRMIINMNKDEDLINQIFKEKRICLISYCKCEVEGSKIIKVLEQVSDLEFSMEANNEY